MKLPKYEGDDVAEASAQFAALQKEAEALVSASHSRIAEIKVRVGGGAVVAVCRAGGVQCAYRSSRVPCPTQHGAQALVATLHPHLLDWLGCCKGW